LDAHEAHPRDISEIMMISSIVTRFLRDQGGATAIEYGLIAGLIAVVIITATHRVGTNLSAKFNTIANNLT
jgi:pilus assembly protein Flp/PilA